MSFIAGAGITNIDLLYTGMKKIPEKGEEVYSEGFELQLGGGIPATLINLSRLGIETKLATQLGDDLFSEFAKKKYGEYGVEPLNLYNGGGIPLNVTSAIVLPDDRSFITYGSGALGADSDAEERFYELARGSKITLMQADGFLNAYKKLHCEGTLLVLDTGWDDSMSVESYADYLEIADYYTPNRKEAMKLTGAASPQEAARALKAYFKRIVVKLDRDGCLGIDENGNAFNVPALNCFEHTDSTGAGDAFLSGFCYGLYHGLEFKTCIKAGNVTGGKAVTGAGALSAYCTEKELLGYLG